MNIFKTALEKYLAGKFHRGKFFLVKLMIKIFRFRSVRSNYGPIICCNSNDFTNILALTGGYGFVISNHIKSLPSDSIFIDIGASYGLYSLVAAQNLVDGNIFSFEPNPIIFKWLKSSIKLNKVTNIRPFNYALGKEDFLMELNYSERHSGGSKLITETQKNRDLQSFTVPVRNIVDLDLFDNSFKERIIHVKMDVEGYETEIIKSIRLAPWYNRVKSIIVEVDNNFLEYYHSSVSELYEILTNDGYVATFGIQPNKHYDEIFIKPIYN